MTTTRPVPTLPNYSVDLDRATRFDDAATMWGWRTMPAHANV